MKTTSKTPGKTHYKEVDYGFEWGSAKFTRTVSERGWVLMEVSTPRTSINIYVTRSGMIKVFGSKRKREK